MTIEDKVVLTAQHDPANLPTDAQGNKVDVVLESTPVARYTEVDALKEAGTDAHAELEDAEQLKQRVQEVITADTTLTGITHRVSEELWGALSNELLSETIKLKTIKSHDDRIGALDRIEQIKHKLATLLDVFII
jgi:hypothetical protein